MKENPLILLKKKKILFNKIKIKDFIQKNIKIRNFYYPQKYKLKEYTPNFKYPHRHLMSEEDHQNIKNFKIIIQKKQKFTLKITKILQSIVMRKANLLGEKLLKKVVVQILKELRNLHPVL